MASEEIEQYYRATAHRDVRADLEFAVDQLVEKTIAVDCGCGAGADIAYLRAKGFIVKAFDSEEEAIKQCKKRFDSDDAVHLSTASFTSFSYPAAALVVAEASLFFCPESEFEQVWHNIESSLIPGGIFCGSFLGPKDTMAGPNYNGEAFWPTVLVFEEQALRKTLSGLQLLRFTEHNVSGHTPQGLPHQWHIYAVVAIKAL